MQAEYLSPYRNPLLSLPQSKIFLSVTTPPPPPHIRTHPYSMSSYQSLCIFLGMGSRYIPIT